MLCENCGENEANVRYTQIINGIKKEMCLCEKCSRELGINGMDLSMPINLSSFLVDFFEDMDTTLLPGLTVSKQLVCDECGMTYDEFTHTGKFGCANCYDAFSSRIDPILKNLQGANRHVGRKTKITKPELKKIEIEKENKQSKLEENSKQTSKLDELKEKLKQAIKEEKYEDAAKIRDEIKELEK